MFSVVQCFYMNYEPNNTLGWGAKTRGGVEIWDSSPVFLGDNVTRRDWLKLMFYPKKWVLYRWIKRDVNRKHIKHRKHLNLRAAKHINTQTLKLGEYRILDVGCGTGAAVIDLKKLFGRSVDVTGLEVVKLQIDVAKEKIKQHGVWAEVYWYDGGRFPFPDGSFDAVYASDVLGHVPDVRSWLAEIYRVLKPGGVLTMFAESELGKHAWIRKYLFTRGLNVDPHAEFHISLYSKITLREFLEATGFEIKRMYGVFWASFFVHPDEFYNSLQNQKRFLFWRLLNGALYWIKKKTHPFSTALCELYGVAEMLTVGRFVEAQGYVVLGRKNRR